MSNTEPLGTVKIEGLAELNKKLDQLPAELRKKLERSALKKALAPTLEAARRHAPVDTGELRDSLKIKTKTEKGVLRGEVSSDLPKAKWIELGHRVVKGGRLRSGGKTVAHVPPHPFMLPALLETSDEAVKLLAAELGKALEKCEVKG